MHVSLHMCTCLYIRSRAPPFGPRFGAPSHTERPQSHRVRRTASPKQALDIARRARESYPTPFHRFTAPSPRVGRAPECCITHITDVARCIPAGDMEEAAKCAHESAKRARTRRFNENYNDSPVNGSASPAGGDDKDDDGVDDERVDVSARVAELQALPPLQLAKLIEDTKRDLRVMLYVQAAAR